VSAASEDGPRRVNEVVVVPSAEAGGGPVLHHRTSEVIADVRERDHLGRRSPVFEALSSPETSRCSAMRIGCTAVAAAVSRW
jgi:hypothetical protein